VYQANRDLSAEETDFMAEALRTFCETWQAHRQDLATSGLVLYDRFVVLAVDERYNAASGCSIDSSVHFIQELEQRFQLSFFDRTQVAFWQDEKINTVKLPEIKAKVEAGVITEETLIFNNLIQNIVEFNTNWQIPAKESWMVRYFPVTVQN
jgi:hypothetical protein